MEREAARGSNPRLSGIAADVLYAWIAATFLSGIPSTLHAWLTGGDVTEAIRAAGAMLVSPLSPLPRLFLAAALTHAAVSLFWTTILVIVLPLKHMLIGAVLAAALIALLDLRVIAPLFFPEVAALAFWPQFADHLMWGLSLGLALHWRRCRRATAQSSPKHRDPSIPRPPRP